MSIDFLEKQLEKAREVISQPEYTGDRESMDFASRLALESFEIHISELEHELSQAKMQREKEVIELRLIGQLADHATLPLLILSDIAKFFSNSIHYAYHHINTGSDAKRGVPKDVLSRVNLQFAGIKAGSSRVLISADNSPDLYGESLTEESLESLFILLSAPTNELSDAAHVIGARSTKHFSHLLNTICTNNLDLEMTWRNPCEKEYRWFGSKRDIQSILDTLNSLKIHDPVQVSVCGKVSMLSQRGKIEMVDDSGSTYKCQFPREMYETVRQFRIGDSVSTELNMTSIVNEKTGTEKVTYDLLLIEHKVT